MTDAARPSGPSTGGGGVPVLPGTASRRAATGRTAAARGGARPAGRAGTRSAAARRSRVPFALVVTGTLAGGLTLLLGLNTMSAANELQRHALSEQDTSVAAQVQQLHDEVALSQAPGNLARAAEALGMVPAGNPAFLVIDAHGTVRVLGSAAPATAAPLPVQPPAPKPTHSPKPETTKKQDAAAQGRNGGATSTKKKKKNGRQPKPGQRTTTPTPPKTTHTPTPQPTIVLGGTR